MNWMSEYWTTWTWFPHGSLKSRPRPGRASASSPSRRRRTSSPIIDHEPEVTSAVGVLRTTLGQH